jgi:hypothetical protein
VQIYVEGMLAVFEGLHNVIIMIMIILYDLLNIVLQNCQTLERMDLEECIQITDSTLNYLGSYCHRLTALVSSNMYI